MVAIYYPFAIPMPVDIFALGLRPTIFDAPNRYTLKVHDIFGNLHSTSNAYIHKHDSFIKSTLLRTENFCQGFLSFITFLKDI